MSFFSKFEQNIKTSPTNSSVANLNANATFTGTSVSTLGVAGIQVALMTDQNCNLYVDQSTDGTNWDIVDSYKYYAGRNFGVTTQAVSSFVRVRVTNLNTATATTYFRLQTVLCPIVEALPRSLNSEGNLKVSIYGSEDEYGFETENTPMGEIRSVEPVRLDPVIVTTVPPAIEPEFGEIPVTTGIRSGLTATSAWILLTVD